MLFVYLLEVNFFSRTLFLFHFFLFFSPFFCVIPGRGDSYSSYDSLDKYNYALETLKLSDSGNYFKGNNCMLQPKCRQPYVHNDRKMETEIINDDLITPKLPPRPPLPKTSQSSTTIDKDLAKQQQLSDWYYIKTGPKSPLPAPRNDKRNGIYGSTTTTSSTTTSSTTATPTPANRTTANILNNNNNTIEGIYGKSGNLSRETTKNHLNVYSENMMMKRVENGNARFNDANHIQMVAAKTNGHDDNHTTDSVYQTINVPSSCDDLQKIYTPLNHQYSGSEPLCKFNLRNNSEQVNGCPKWQQPQERLNMMPPPSPSVLSKKVHPQHQQQHQQQSHPFYYVEPSKKHLSSPRQDKHTQQSVEYQQKSCEPQCEQIQVASKLQTHNERLSSTAMVAASTAPSAAATVATMTSNPNVHKVSGIHSLSHHQTDHCGNANSSSFEHVNVTSGFSSLSASSEMTIDDKRQRSFKTDQIYADEQCFRSSNNVVGDSRQCLQQTVSSSPLMPATDATASGAHPAQVSDSQSLFVCCLFVMKETYPVDGCCYCCQPKIQRCKIHRQIEMQIVCERVFLSFEFLFTVLARHSIQFPELQRCDRHTTTASNNLKHISGAIGASAKVSAQEIQH